MKTMTEKVVIIMIILTLAGMWWAIHNMVEEIEERGVKHILSEIWNGPVK